MADGLTGLAPQWGMTLARTESEPGLKERLRAYERQLIRDALERAGGNQRRAAMILGCLPTTLNEKMRRLGLRERDAATDDAPDDSPPDDADRPY
jgi:DNA-binding NtrC family response regulator